MGTLELLLRVAGGLLLTGANAFFVMAEFALTRLPQLDSADDPPGLEHARSMLDRLEIYLTACQLGITTSSILLGVIAEPAFTFLLLPLFQVLGLSASISHGVSIVLAIVVINLIHKIWGEQAPTYLGVERPRQIARHTAWALDAWTTATYPFIILGDGLAKWTLGLFGVEVQRSWTEEGGEDDEPIVGPGAVRREIGEILSRANLSTERSHEILRAVEIENIPVRRIMVPRADAVALSTASDLQESLRMMREHPYDRYPLLGSGWDEVLGTLYLTEVFRHLPALERGAMTLADVAEPMVWVDPELPVSDLIDRFQSEQQELALVRDEGRVRGLVTATDAFEAIAGELEDPADVNRRQAENQQGANDS